MSNVSNLSLGSMALKQLAEGRWFQDKSSIIQSCRILDYLALEGGLIALAEIKSAASEQVYLLFLEKSEDSSQLQLVSDEGPLVEALMKGLLQSGTLQTQEGRIFYEAYEEQNSKEGVQLSAFSEDHSNSVFIKDKKRLLKLYRKLESGDHPEEKVLALLKGSQLAPKLFAKLSWTTTAFSEPFLVGLEQELVDNSGTMWDWLQDKLLQTAATLSPQETLQQSSEALGVTLANFHNLIYTLSNFTVQEQPGVPFQAGDFQAKDLVLLEEKIQKLYLGNREYLQDSITFEQIEAYLNIQKAFLGYLGVKFKQHGDFHLGQLLRTRSGFKIIDFEGQPVNSLNERWEARSPMQDLASILRSIQYAEAFALKASKVEAHNSIKKNTEAMQESFKAAYEHIAQFPLPKPLEPLLNIEILLKTLQELDYERKTRPQLAWVCLEALQRQLQT